MRGALAVSRSQCRSLSGRRRARPFIALPGRHAKAWLTGWNQSLRGLRCSKAASAVP